MHRDLTLSGPTPRFLSYRLSVCGELPLDAEVYQNQSCRSRVRARRAATHLACTESVYSIRRALSALRGSFDIYRVTRVHTPQLVVSPFADMYIIHVGG